MSSEEEPLAVPLTDDEVVVEKRKRRVVGSVIATTLGLVSCAFLHSRQSSVHQLDSIVEVETCVDDGVVASCPAGESTSMLSLGDWTVCGSNAILPTQEVVFVGGVEQCMKDCTKSDTCKGIQWVQGADVSGDICIAVHEDICQHMTIEKPVGTASSPAPRAAMCMIKQCGKTPPSACTDGQDECCPLCHKEAHQSRIVDQQVSKVLLSGGVGLPANMRGIFWKVSDDGNPSVWEIPDLISFALNTDGCGRNLGKLVDGDMKVNLCGDRTVGWMPRETAPSLKSRKVLQWFQASCACNIKFSNVAGAGTASAPTAYRLAMECGDAELPDDVAVVVRRFNDDQFKMNILDTMNFVPSTFGNVLPDGTEDCGGRDWGCKVWDHNGARPADQCDPACWDGDDATACPQTDCTIICDETGAAAATIEGCVVCGNPNAPGVKCLDCTANPFSPRCIDCPTTLDDDNIPEDPTCAGIERKRVQTGCVGWGITSGVAPNEKNEATLLQAFDEDGVARTDCGARELFGNYGSVPWTTFTNTKECLLA